MKDYETLFLNDKITWDDMKEIEKSNMFTVMDIIKEDPVVNHAYNAARKNGYNVEETLAYIIGVQYALRKKEIEKNKKEMMCSTKPFVSVESKGQIFFHKNIGD